MNKESFCIWNWLHNFQIVGNHSEGVLEMCIRCKKRVFFKTINGRIDNWNYIKYHNKQLLPKNHQYFNHEFEKK